MNPQSANTRATPSTGRIRRRGYAGALALAAVACVLWTWRDVPAQDKSPAARRKQALQAARRSLPDEAIPLVIGPYLQNGGRRRMTVMWEAKKPARGMVEYGTSPDALDRFVLTPVARRVSEAPITGLSPGAAYFYRVRVGSIVSAVYSFRTFPAGAGKPFRFLAYGDSRSYPADHRKVARAMAREKDALFVLNTGDMVRHGDKREEWKTMLFDPLGDLPARLPLLPVMGNHEEQSPFYFEYFSIPGPGNENYYSMVVGDMKLLVVDNTLPPFEVGAPQLKWLEAELASNTSRWLVVAHHIPVHSTGKHGPGPIVKYFRAIQEPLYKKYRVDLVLQGHDHNYERLMVSGITYVTSGGGGANLRDQKVKDSPDSKVFFKELHYCVLEVTPDRLSGRAVSAAGKELDRFTLTHETRKER